MRSLRTSPTRGDAHVCVRSQYRSGTQGTRSSGTRLVKKRLRALVRALAPRKRQNLQVRSIQLLGTQHAEASREHALAPHLLHCGMLTVRVQRQDAHNAQRVNVAVGFHHRADRVALPRKAAGSSFSAASKAAQLACRACAMSVSTSSDSAYGSSPSR